MSHLEILLPAKSCTFKAAVFLLFGLELEPKIIDLTPHLGLNSLRVRQLLLERIDLGNQVSISLEKRNLCA
jgi:hypothetical protein